MHHVEQHPHARKSTLRIRRRRRSSKFVRRLAPVLLLRRSLAPASQFLAKLCVPGDGHDYDGNASDSSKEAPALVVGFVEVPVAGEAGFGEAEVGFGAKGAGPTVGAAAAADSIGFGLPLLEFGYCW